MIFENIIGIGCDIWALACTIYEIRCGQRLFYDFDGDGKDTELIMAAMLGKFPQRWWSKWPTHVNYFDELGQALVANGRPVVSVDRLEVTIGSGTEVFVNYGDDVKRLSVSVEEAKLLADLLANMLRYDHTARISMDEVFLHDYWQLDARSVGEE